MWENEWSIITNGIGIGGNRMVILGNLINLLEFLQRGKIHEKCYLEHFFFSRVFNYCIGGEKMSGVYLML